MLSNREVLFLNESNRIENLDRLTYNIESDEGQAKAWAYFREISKNQNLFSLGDACYAQGLLMKEQESVGEHLPLSTYGAIRNPENRLNVSVGFYRAPSFEMVPELMKKYMSDLKMELNKPAMPPLDIAAKFHKRFESIHPFADGNGRIGRIIANYIIKYFELPIMIFTFDDRHKYYEACKSEGAMIKYFRNKFMEYAICFNGDNDLVKRVSRGIESDFYECDKCNSKFTLDWESSLNVIPVRKD